MVSPESSSDRRQILRCAQNDSPLDRSGSSYDLIDFCRIFSHIGRMVSDNNPAGIVL